MRLLGVAFGALLGWLAVVGRTTTGLDDSGWYTRGRQS